LLATWPNGRGEKLETAIPGGAAWICLKGERIIPVPEWRRKKINRIAHVEKQ